MSGHLPSTTYHLPQAAGLVDTHCHIHEADYPLDAWEVIMRAREVGVKKMICVGTNEKSSVEALEFIKKHNRTDIEDVLLTDEKNVSFYAAVGVHPHDTKDGYGKIAELVERWSPQQLHMDAMQGSSEARNEPYKQYGDVSTGAANAAARHESPAQAAVLPDRATVRLVAVGEIGLDYFYTHSPREVQIAALEAQIQIALDHNLPIIFHVREAFDDFWPVFDNFHGIKGELHSFTDNQVNLEQGLKRGLYIGVNGISTFTKDPVQQELFAHIPLESLLLETDAPFLTPVPKRGTINEPAFVRYVAEFHARIRGVSYEEIAVTTTANATKLFGL